MHLSITALYEHSTWHSSVVYCLKKSSFFIPQWGFSLIFERVVKRDDYVSVFLRIKRNLGQPISKNCSTLTHQHDIVFLITRNEIMEESAEKWENLY